MSPPKHRSAEARALRTSRFRPRIVRPRKGKGSYQRKGGARISSCR